MPFEDRFLVETRRDFFRKSMGGIGAIALAHVMAQDGRTADTGPANPLAPRKPHFEPKAKNVIFLFQGGGPSQIDLYDPKPALRKWHGTPLPASMTKDLTLAFVKPDAKVLGSDRTFIRHGKSGIEYSDYIPHIGAQADDICLIRSMFCLLYTSPSPRDS